jgi:hypothetical protein
MAIQVLCRIRLPYIIKLDGDFDVISPNYQCSIFQKFELTFLYNNKDDDELYDPHLDEQYCRYVLIKCIIRNWDISKYTLKPIGKVILPGSKEEKEIVVIENVPDNDRSEIFKLISKKFNDLLYYIRSSTGMFWLNPISINNISGVMGNNTPFCFYTEDSPVDELNYSITYYDSFMENIKDIQPLGSDLLRSYKMEEEDWKRISQNYLHKAKTALHENDYHDAIIYTSISAESFIKSYISSITKKEGYEDDIVFKKLIDNSNQNILDSYYNAILKYVRGKSLIEINNVAHQKLSSLYKLRNAIMHRGLLDKTSLEKAGFNEFGHKECKELIEITENIQESILKMENQWKYKKLNSESDSKHKYLSFEVLEINELDNNEIKVSFKFKDTNYIAFLNNMESKWKLKNVYHAGLGCECGLFSFLCKNKKVFNFVETILEDYITPILKNSQHK